MLRFWQYCLYGFFAVVLVLGENRFRGEFGASMFRLKSKRGFLINFSNFLIDRVLSILLTLEEQRRVLMFS